MINVLLKWLIIAFFLGLLLHVIWRTWRTEPSKRRMALCRGVVRIALVYLATVILMAVGENLLIFHPLWASVYWCPPSEAAIEDVWLTTAAGTRIHAWWCPVANPRWTVLYCHGAGGNLSFGQRHFERWRKLGASVLIFDYPGYGRSEGWPTEAGCHASAHAAYDWLIHEKHVEPDKLVLHGQSLGGAMAVELAVTRPHRALVLQSAFTSVPDVAQHLFPLFPARLLTRSRFDNLARLQEYRGPIFISHGDADPLVPFEEAERLFSTVASKHKFFYRVPGGGHSNGSSHGGYGVAAEFISHLPDCAPVNSYHDPGEVAP
jgi:uncharacterized protein